MNFKPKEYKAPFYFKNGHINTFYPTFFRKELKVDFIRERLSTPDQDFIDVDLVQNQSKNLAILCHGLEGSSSSKYILGTSHILSQRNWDVAAINYRGCSGVMNKNLRMYHSGATDDLQVVIDQYIDNYDLVTLVGFSLGGNLVLKYLGENGSEVNPKIKTAVAFSVPLDLKAASLHIGKRSNWFYAQNFLRSLKAKVLQKSIQFPGQLNTKDLKKMNSVYDFDNKYTAPIHGFEDADDYYFRSSSIRYLKTIKVPALIVTALDDPFLPEECYPYELIEKNKMTTFITPKFGGHVGFSSINQKHFWNEVLIADYLDELISR